LVNADKSFELISTVSSTETVLNIATVTSQNNAIAHIHYVLIAHANCRLDAIKAALPGKCTVQTTRNPGGGVFLL